MSLAARIPALLIANRGEIACRIARTARRLGIRVIAVHSDADSHAPHVRLADEAHRLGPAPARESYLQGERIIAIARRSGAAAIHPGYGFLSENAAFAQAVLDSGLIWVGPPPAAIAAMGLKDAAKTIAARAGVPVVPGYHGADQGDLHLAAEAEGIGYPVLIKAVAGGGGKGMKRVDRGEEFPAALASARREALAAFGDDRVLIERYVQAPRHIEVQVFADSHGEVIHLFERDCSLQRRHQKVLEEAPAPGMSEALRAAMGRAAVEAARAVGYVGAGTVEFIADGATGLRPDGFFFMEMNTRLQVEHPVTEMITGLDLVEWQLRVAAGETLPLRQQDVPLRGHAVEARLYAENPEADFLPSIGTIVALRLPEGEGLRVDAGVEEGGSVTPHYDPMIAKIIAHGETRDVAFDRLARALDRTLVAGPKTNLGFLSRLVRDRDVRAGRLDTGLIPAKREALGAVPQPIDSGQVTAASSALQALAEQGIQRREATRRGLAGVDALARDPWFAAPLAGFGRGPERTLRVVAEGETLAVIVPTLAEGRIPGESAAPAAAPLVLVPDGEAILAIAAGRQTRVTLHDPLDVDLDAADGAGATIVSPMHGKLVAVLVAPGERVQKGQKLAIVEAMKMEHGLVAPRDGVVEAVVGAAGAQVAERAPVVTLAAEAG